jgi:hypothetical protein
MYNQVSEHKTKIEIHIVVYNINIPACTAVSLGPYYVAVVVAAAVPSKLVLVVDELPFVVAVVVVAAVAAAAAVVVVAVVVVAAAAAAAAAVVVVVVAAAAAVVGSLVVDQLVEGNLLHPSSDLPGPALLAVDHSSQEPCLLQSKLIKISLQALTE